jgi:uncharacterized membrane protein
MKTRLRNIWDSLRASFWFIPTLMVLLSILLSVITVYLDDEADLEFIKELQWAWTGGASGSREMLSTIAGSMMTVTGVTFSITIVSLTLAANQFGPRVLRSFIRDRGNQFVLGTFISTFTFSLMVLGRVREGEDDAFIPYFSVTVAVGLALASIGVLIYFIHHISYSIQAENLIANISEELHEVMNRLFPERVGKPAPKETGEKEAHRIKQQLAGKSFLIRSNQSGYLQTVEVEQLMAITKENNLYVELFSRPGAFVSADTALLEVWPLDVYPGELHEKMNERFIIAQRRTPVQDVEYSLHQLVEVALRALSPSLNDPYTAINCVDRLGAALVQFAQREMPSKYRYDEMKQLRIYADTTTFKGLVDISFNQIREYGSTSIEVTLRMLEHLALIAEHTYREEDREVLRRHAQLIKEQAVKGIKHTYDQERVELSFSKTLRAIALKTSRSPSYTPDRPTH